MPMITTLQPGAPTAPFAIDSNGVRFGSLYIDFAASADEADTRIIVLSDGAGDFTLEGIGPIVAIVHIPACRYREESSGFDPMTGQPTTVRVPEPLDHNRIHVELWPYIQ